MDAISAYAPLAAPTPELPSASTTGAEAGEAFEAYLVGFLATQMRASVPEGPFSSGPAAMFADLFDQEIGRRVASGPGIGLKAELARSLGAASDHEISHPAQVRTTSSFGTRADPFTGERRQHQGVDLAAPTGTPIHAAKAGVVRYAGEQAGYGKVVIIDHGGGLTTRYAHCDTLLAPVGASVAAGQELATVGSTGRATGPHLHFEVRQDGVAIDPTDWLNHGQARAPLGALAGRD